MAVGSLKRSSLTAYAKYDSMLAGNTFTPTTFDYEHLGTVTTASALSSVVITLPAGASTSYKNLQVRLNTYDGRTGAITNSPVYLKFNSDSSASYTYHQLAGSGSAASSYGSPSADVAGCALTSGPSAGWGASITDILDAFSTTRNKTLRSLSGSKNSAGGVIVLESNSWVSTAAISTLTFTPFSGTFAVGSRFSIYGSKG